MSKKLCKDTEIKAFCHWHFEFSMARFWAVPVFCNKVWTVWSAYATADYPARPGRPHGQTYQHKSPLDNGEIFLYSRSWLVGLRNRCWIKGLGWMRWPAGLREDGMSAKVRVRISRIMPQNVYTRPVLQLGKVLRVYTSTDAKWLKSYDESEIFITISPHVFEKTTTNFFTKCCRMATYFAHCLINPARKAPNGALNRWCTELNLTVKRKQRNLLPMNCRGNTAVWNPISLTACARTHFFGRLKNMKRLIAVKSTQNVKSLIYF